MELPNNLPSKAALQGLMDELNQAMKRVPDAQQRLMSLSAAAWSSDRMVKAVVGPRGQLVDIDIDQRVFRNPDAKALKASILAATASAVRSVTAQAQEIMVGELPPELAELRARFDPDNEDPAAQVLQTDAELVRRRREDGNLR